MVGFSNEEKTLHQWQYMFAGGASGALTRTVSQPLDVLKIRFQLQVEPISKGSKYSSMLQACRHILKEESIFALWSGHIPAQYLSISYGIVQFWCYELLTEKCYKATEKNSSHSLKPLINFSCGAVAGGSATVVSFPFDTIRTRLVAEAKNARVYEGVWHTFFHMVEYEGASSLFKGLLPTLAQVAPYAGIQFMFYKIFVEVFGAFDSANPNNVKFSTSLYAGSLAGLMAKVGIYPFDLTKKRLQIQGFQHHRSAFGKQFVCDGFLDCIKNTIKHEGASGLYKGLYPSLLKAMLASALHFTFFEEICKAFRTYS